MLAGLSVVSFSSALGRTMDDQNTVPSQGTMAPTDGSRSGHQSQAGMLASLLVSSPDNKQTGGGKMGTTVESRTVSVRFSRSFQTVYEFLVNPENWNGWARGLGKSIRRSKNGWIADTENGTIGIRFTPRNAFGVVDHHVTRKSGSEIYVPMRLIANGSGSELLFTLFREPDMSDERYAADMELVKQDLNALKDQVER
jgi:hypothetical protein